jgi:hypothetical protein
VVVVLVGAAAVAASLVVAEVLEAEEVVAVGKASRLVQFKESSLHAEYR